MPIYEYHCSKCSDVIEQMQRVSDPPLSQCPQCGGQVSRLISRSSFQLKGAGWYVTDYKRKGAEGGSSESKSESTSSKPAPKACGGGGCGSGSGD